MNEWIDKWTIVIIRSPDDELNKLVFNENSYQFDIAHYCVESKEWRDKEEMVIDVTHWRDIPAIPTSLISDKAFDESIKRSMGRPK